MPISPPIEVADQCTASTVEPRDQRHHVRDVCGTA